MADAILFSPIDIQGLHLVNRITMAPLFLGYANPDGTVSDRILHHYQEMGTSGAAMIVVENAVIHPGGLGSPFTLRVDGDKFLPGLQRLADVIHQGGAKAVLQINHAGRYAFMKERVAPSPVQTGRVTPRELSVEEIRDLVEAFAAGAAQVKAAGFDAVELHGGTGYLLSQFLSARTNHRSDAYGGPLEARMRFPLEVVQAVREQVGAEYPVGYRFLADEGVPDGIHTDETIPFAEELEQQGIAYLSVMAGTYDSFFLPESLAAEKSEGYMTGYAATIKTAVKGTPVITAGRIQQPETAERILQEGNADLIGLARVLLADPLWPKKAAGHRTEPIVPCEPNCSFCMKRVMKGKPAFCPQWPKARRDAFLAETGEDPVAAEKESKQG